MKIREFLLLPLAHSSTFFVTTSDFCLFQLVALVVEKMTIQEVNECEEEIDIVEVVEGEPEDNNIVEEIECYDYYDDDDDDEEDDYDDYSGYDEPDEERGKPPDKPFYGDHEKNTGLSVDYFQILNKQIFLGMVSMQYQPLHDMVRYIIRWLSQLLIDLMVRIC